MRFTSQTAERNGSKNRSEINLIWTCHSLELVGLAVIFLNKRLLVLLSEKLLVQLSRLERVPLRKRLILLLAPSVYQSKRIWHIPSRRR
jgi:hypothetical protein